MGFVELFYSRALLEMAAPYVLQCAFFFLAKMIMLDIA